MIPSIPLLPTMGGGGIFAENYILFGMVDFISEIAYNTLE